MKKQRIHPTGGCCVMCKRNETTNVEQNNNEDIHQSKTQLPHDGDAIMQTVEEFTSTKDSTDTTSVEQKTVEEFTYYNEHKRLCNPDHGIKNIIEVLSTSHLNNVINIVDSTFGFNMKTVQSKFNNMKQAKEYFTRMFSYMNSEQSCLDIFDFKYPMSCIQLIDGVTLSSLNTLRMDMKGIRTLYDNGWLNDSVMNLLMECLNIVNISTITKANVPDYVFGSTFDADYVIPDDTKYPYIKAFLKVSVDEETVELRAQCESEVKSWYCSHKKGKLSKILDAFYSRGQSLTNYVTCVNLSYKHWILLKVNLININNTPKVVTIDSSNGPDNQARMFRLWFSKFFALNLIEKKLGQCSDTNYSIDNLKAVMANRTNDFDKSKDPMIDQCALKSNVSQMDNFNCGIFSLMRCLEFHGNTIILKQTSSREESMKKDNERQRLFDIGLQYRLKLLSMIACLYECFNGEIYNQLREHIYMSRGNFSSRNDIEKFQLIHKLFDKKQFRLKLGYDNGEDVCNANIIFETTSLKTLKDIMHQSKKSKKKNNQSVATSKSPSRKKPRQIPLQLTNGLPPCSLPTLIFDTSQHSRHQIAFDLSSAYIVLKAFSTSSKSS